MKHSLVDGIVFRDRDLKTRVSRGRGSEGGKSGRRREGRGRAGGGEGLQKGRVQGFDAHGLGQAYGVFLQKRSIDCKSLQ